VALTGIGTKRTFTREEALAVATRLGMDFERLKYDIEQFRMGLDVELEHGLRSPETDATGDDSVDTAKIALAHLNEFPDYYTRLAVLEREAADHCQDGDGVSALILSPRPCLESRHRLHMSRVMRDTCAQPVSPDPGHRPGSRCWLRQ
jgi:hypothetical protein